MGLAQTTGLQAIDFTLSNKNVEFDIEEDCFFCNQGHMSHGLAAMESTTVSRKRNINSDDAGSGQKRMKSTAAASFDETLAHSNKNGVASDIRIKICSGIHKYGGLQQLGKRHACWIALVAKDGVDHTHEMMRELYDIYAMVLATFFGAALGFLALLPDSNGLLQHWISMVWGMVTVVMSGCSVTYVVVFMAFLRWTAKDDFLDALLEFPALTFVPSLLIFVNASVIICFLLIVIGQRLSAPGTPVMLGELICFMWGCACVGIVVFHQQRMLNHAYRKALQKLGEFDST